MSKALLFPGQGSQEPGMGRDLAEASVDAMNMWKLAEKVSGIALREIYWGGDEAAMADTRNLQPALTAANLALWRHIAPYFSPSCAAGHSLGEFSALCAAGALAPEHALELVSLRGRLMSQADPDGKGSMAAIVKLSLSDVKECVAEAQAATGEMLVIANYNTPGQFVVSGVKAAVEAVQEPVKARKGRAVPLAVSGAFHSPMMCEAAMELNRAVELLCKKELLTHARMPVYSNASGASALVRATLREELGKQMTSSVLWIDTIRNMWDAGVREFVECGPKGVLTKMVGPILHDHIPVAAAGGEGVWKALGVGNLEQARTFMAG